jgi:hypothetical protein
VRQGLSTSQGQAGPISLATACAELNAGHCRLVNATLDNTNILGDRRVRRVERWNAWSQHLSYIRLKAAPLMPSKGRADPVSSLSEYPRSRASAASMPKAFSACALKAYRPVLLVADEQRDLVVELLLHCCSAPLRDGGKLDGQRFRLS